ncbi:MAG TPA: hypothetical protein VFQ96_02950 [Microbacteriaceae bacterium]|nr:hypothetical protein [Microbacteriaceae bacterium]
MGDVAEDDWTSLTVVAFGPLAVAAGFGVTVWAAGPPAAAAAFLLGAAVSAARARGAASARRPVAELGIAGVVAAAAALVGGAVALVAAAACLGFLSLVLTGVSLSVLARKFRTRRGDAEAWVAALVGAGVLIGGVPTAVLPVGLGWRVALLVEAAIAIAAAAVLRRHGAVTDRGRLGGPAASRPLVVGSLSNGASGGAGGVLGASFAADLAAALCCVTAVAVLAVLPWSADGRYLLPVGEVAAAVTVAGLAGVGGFAAAGVLPGARPSNGILWCALAASLAAAAGMLWPPVLLRFYPVLWFTAVAALLGGSFGVAAARLRGMAGRPSLPRTAARWALVGVAGILAVGTFAYFAAGRSGVAVVAASAIAWLSLTVAGVTWCVVARGRGTSARASVPAAAAPSQAPDSARVAVPVTTVVMPTAEAASEVPRVSAVEEQHRAPGHVSRVFAWVPRRPATKAKGRAGRPRLR